MRVVLYGEGTGELGGTLTQLPTPGRPLENEMLGAAHIIVKRALCELAGRDPSGIRFDSPQRVRGRLPRGSDLLHAASLRQLTVWPWPEQKPELVVVLVDADGEKQRRTLVQGHLAAATVPAVVGVAIQEFEAWLIADSGAVSEFLGCEPPIDPSRLSNPERLSPREAKSILQQWIAGSENAPEEERVTRRRIAGSIDLEVLRSRCKAFADFVSELGAPR